MDMGKNTLHMIGLDSRGAIVLREKVSRRSQILFEHACEWRGTQEV
jgi:hypothetical protein